MASRSGITVYVLIGLAALGSSRDPACEARRFDADFSFEPDPGATTPPSSDPDEDFSFEPEPEQVPAAAPESETAAAEPETGADTGSDLVEDLDLGPDDPAGCNDAVVVESAGGGALVPVGTDMLGASADLDCTMGEGDGDDDAVTVLQDALVRCNGQAVTVDGGYGPLTAVAVAAVERQHGAPADGVYGPETRQVMQWPMLSGAGCAGGVAPPAG